MGKDGKDELDHNSPLVRYYKAVYHHVLTIPHRIARPNVEEPALLMNGS